MKGRGIINKLTLGIGMELQEEVKPCLICKRVALRRPMERLPNGGIKWRVDHGEGEICEWEEYDDIKQMAEPRRGRPAKRGKPEMVICPVCSKPGLVAVYFDKTPKGGAWRYRVRHKGGKDRKGVLHHTKTPEDRENILKQIGRYIPDNPVINSPVKRRLGRPRRYWNIETAARRREITRKHYLEIIKALRDKFGKPVDVIAEKVVRDMEVNKK